MWRYLRDAVRSGWHSLPRVDEQGKVGITDNSYLIVANIDCLKAEIDQCCWFRLFHP